MQSPSTKRHSPEFPDPILDAVSGLMDRTDPAGEDKVLKNSAPIQFQGHYVGHMLMCADVETVTQYFAAHQGWFRRCAHPMQADMLGSNGYALTVGRFGALDYEVEPKIGLHLLPEEGQVYRIQTIPIPGYEPQGYSVDFQAAMHLAGGEEAATATPSPSTQVKWELKLLVDVQFPRFIQALPRSMVKATGDRVLNQIVRQVSNRLTHKVQEDFHTTLNLAMPIQPRPHFWQRLRANEDA
ncbi:MAG: DUF1997 domain-containing protein [Leptolyngbyaceae cyanobacterium SM1_1_3]|nr:DUF1997 domain-containing protein [Leptolyngbyaceae cyanobacterium SM1_1_3]NJN01952.1 DUF1997 domain-containing protein [Leptolyngbyaceae cyanobacterium RM1_1_2]NJO10593.1 DUF1997 domain-containing protein [Leptolyngbyaceae cyanobacterium SL_1_1]